MSKVNPSAALRPKVGGRILEKHEAFPQQGQRGAIDLLFLGDSVTSGWSSAPGTWRRYFAHYQPANFGVPSDQTQNLIWRLVYGELDHLSPKVVVVNIGTHNTKEHTGPQIAEAQAKIVRLIRRRFPETRVLLLGILPRSAGMGNADSIEAATYRSGVIRKANALVGRLDDGNAVRFLDIGGRFLGPGGQVRRELMPDGVHPNEAGYRVWAEAMRPLLEEMIQQ